MSSVVTVSHLRDTGSVDPSRMDLNQLLVFVRVVQAGSMRGAAELLGMPKSTISRKILELEQRLDARLLQRTTRRFGLTDIGRIYYDHCVRIVMDIENAEHAVLSQHETPRGLLRVTAPVNLAMLGPILADYLVHHPEVRLELFSTGRMVDLIEERFDVGIRTGRLVDSSLVAKRLGTIEWILVATPRYLKKRGRPKSPAELAQHDCLLFGSTNTVTLVHEEGSTHTLSPTPKLLVTDMDVLLAAANEGLGIAIIPALMCGTPMRGLERVLPSWSPPPTPLHAIYPSTRHLSPTVRSFIDHLQTAMATPAWGHRAK